MLSEIQCVFGNDRLGKVAEKWGVSPFAAALMLLGREYKEFWEWVNADEFLNTFVEQSGDERTTLLEKRAIRITELNEELHKARGIIERFVWGVDATEDQRMCFREKAARFAGCEIPLRPEQCGSDNKSEKEDAREDVKENVREDNTGYICQECALDKGAVWPKGHCATHFSGVCPSCDEEKGLCSVGDWNWPKGSKRPERSAGRD